MLTTPERLLFLLLLVTTIFLAARATLRIIRIISRGRGKPDWAMSIRRAWEAFAKTITFSPVLRDRLLPSLLHGFVGWAFIYYLLVNLGDLLTYGCEPQEVLELTEESFVRDRAVLLKGNLR